MKGAQVLVQGATSFGIMFDGYNVSLYSTTTIGAGLRIGVTGIEGNLTDPDDRSGSPSGDISFVGFGLGLGGYWESSTTVPVLETNLDEMADAIREFFGRAESEGVELKLTPEELREHLLEEYDRRNSSNEDSNETYETSPSSSASGIEQ